MIRRVNRRRFLQSASMVGAGLWVSGSARWSPAKSPNEKIHFACIGVGGKGSSDTDHAAQHGNIVALCDIDDQRLGKKAEQYPRAKTFNDFRKMFDQMAEKIDAVTVSTPDHTHAVAGLSAMRLGKHLYCQKPLTHTVHEARVMLQTARQSNVTTQMGNQGTAADGFRRGVEIIRSGIIGAVREVHVWTNRPFKYWKQAPDIVARPEETPPVPEHVHWNLFLGPARYRPYHPVYHPHDWRGWWDFGTGALGDMACHTTNLPFLALELGYPTRVSAENSPVNPETYPAWATITYEFPERGDRPPVKLVWYEGARDGKRNLPSPELLHGQEPPSSGSLLIGETGTLFSPDDYGNEQTLLPEKQFEGYEPPEPTLERFGTDRIDDENHMYEWVRAIQGGPPTTSNFEYAAVLTEAMILGNVAVRVGQPLEYDAATQKVVNCPEAEQLINPEYRSGWTL